MPATTTISTVVNSEAPESLNAPKKQFHQITAFENAIITFFASISLPHRIKKWESGWREWCSNEHRENKLGLFAFRVLHSLVNKDNPVKRDLDSMICARWFLTHGRKESPEIQEELKELHITDSTEMKSLLKSRDQKNILERIEDQGQ